MRKRRCQIVLLALLLCACGQQDSARDMLENYLWRLSNVLDMDAPALELPPQPLLPRLRERTLEPSDFDVDILEFLSLQGCELGELVGYRNSSLGRVMPTSQRLLYELRFLEASQSCLPQLDAEQDAELIAELQRVTIIKQREIGIHVWNMVFAGPEFAALFSASATLPPPGPSDSLPQSLQDLRQLEGLLSKLLRDDDPGAPVSTGLEAILARIASSQAGGKLIQRMQALARTSQLASEMLDAARKARKLCPMQRTTERGRYLRNVFDQFYAGDLQPYAVPAFREGRELLEVLERIRVLSDMSPGKTMQAYWDTAISTGNGSIYADMKLALDAHIKAWQAALGECQLMPGQ